MSNRLSQRIAELSRDTAAVRMASGVAIRKRGEQRARRLVVASTVAVLAVLVAVGAGAYTLVDRRGAAPNPPGGSPSPTPSATVSTSPSPTAKPAAPAVTSIPASALLRLSDLKLASQPAISETMAVSDLVQLRACGTAYASDSQRRANRRMSAIASVPVFNHEEMTSIEEQLYGYQSGGAAQFLEEIRGQLSRCPGEIGEKTKRWTMTADDLGGDESLLIKVVRLHRYLDDQPPVEQSMFVAVGRVGNLVVILADHGWESGSGHEPIVRQLVPVALQRAAVVR